MAGLAQMGEYAGRSRPDLSAGHLRAVGWGALETLAMSALGTLLAMVLGRCWRCPPAASAGCAAARLLLNALRAMPELVWAR
jgi:phosphonate transport system permease protein